MKSIFSILTIYITPTKTPRGFKEDNKVIEDPKKFYRELGVVLSIALDS